MLKQNKRKARKLVDRMCNNLDGDVTKSYRMNTQFIFECFLCWLALGCNLLFELNVSHKYYSSSLAAVLHINKSNAAGNSKRLHAPDLVEKNCRS